MRFDYQSTESPQDMFCKNKVVSQQLTIFFKTAQRQVFLCEFCRNIQRATILQYASERVPLEAVKNCSSDMIGIFVLKKKKEKIYKKTKKERFYRCKQKLRNKNF